VQPTTILTPHFELTADLFEMFAWVEQNGKSIMTRQKGSSMYTNISRTLIIFCLKTIKKSNKTTQLYLDFLTGQILGVQMIVL
jgi:hypothetical protein